MENNLEGPAKVKAMAEEAKQIDQSQSFMEPGTKTEGKKRGPKGPWKNKKDSGGAAGMGSAGNGPTLLSGPTPEQIQAETIKSLEQILDPLWSLIDAQAVAWAGDDRRASLGERKPLVVHTSAICLNQYFPDALGRHAPLILLTVTVATWSVGVFAVRADNIRKLREEKRLRDEAASGPRENRANGAAGAPIPVQ